MQKLDAIVATAGAAILAIAVVGAALTATHEGAFLGTPRERQILLDDGNANHPTEGAYTDTFLFEVPPSGVSVLFVNATATYLAQGPAGGPAIHALLRAPNGTAYEMEGVAGGSATQPTLTASFLVPLAAAPVERTLRTASEEEARAQLTEAPPGEWAGEWTLEVSFSPGLAPAMSSTIAWEAQAQAWTWDVTPRVAPAR